MRTLARELGGRKSDAGSPLSRNKGPLQTANTAERERTTSRNCSPPMSICTANAFFERCVPEHILVADKIELMLPPEYYLFILICCS